MRTAEEVLSNLTLVAFVLLGVVSLFRWRLRRGAAHGWAAAAFVSLAAVGVAALFIGEDEASLWVTKLLVGLLVLFPFFIYRFAVGFERASRTVEGIAVALTAGLGGWTLFVPEFPQEGDPRPSWFAVYSLVLLAQWTFLFVTSAVRLWRGGSKQPTLARRRMRMLAMGAAGLDLVIVLGIAFPTDSRSPVLGVAIGSLTLLTTLLFFVGIAPPRALRILWRQPEQTAMGATTGRLLTATSIGEVAAIVLPPASQLIGARGAALLGDDGTPIGTFGEIDPVSDRERATKVELQEGTLLLLPSPYTPFFGREELDLVRSLGTFTDLALQRASTFQREREFIANAAHELRTPLAAITGLAATLSELRERMSQEQIDECLSALDRQGIRAVSLVNNLLDLAHVEHAGVKLVPTPVVDSIKRVIDGVPPPPAKTVQIQATTDPKVAADPVRLEQVVTNLLVNAYRYGGHTIDVRVLEEGDEVMIRVEDDGPGVPAELVHKLFEPFTRATGSNVVGSGLGLAITQKIVHAFGGQLTYESRPEGGAAFVIGLRRAS